MIKRLIIIGAGGHGKVVADIAMRMKKWGKISFLDDDESKKTCIGLKIIGKIEDALKYKDEADFFVAFGDNSVRQNFQVKLEKEGYSIAKLIHPSAIIGMEVSVDNGTVVMAGVVINCLSKIGKGCIINTSSSLDHNNTIEDYVHISPGAHLAGTVRIGTGNWIGMGCVISNNVNVCKGCLVGAGAVILNNINEAGTYVGVPVSKIGQ
ncbi:acetyltransferase [Alkalibacterium sp. f15]|uniref:acetyltransferase n=1 Tax=Alkalibacterium sp. f15 TaxID=3414029 RepID=UPI003BF8C8B7